MQHAGTITTIPFARPSWVSNLRHWCCALALASVATGCGIVKVSGLPGGTSGSRSSTAQGAANGPAAGQAASGATSPAAASGPSAKPDDALVKIYRAMTWKNLQGRSWTEIFNSETIPTSTIYDRGNPDPGWILVWSDKGSDVDNAKAVIQAAANRTWQPQCFEDYADYRAGWAKLDAQYRPELDELRKAGGNYYGRATGLVSLMAKVVSASRQAKLALPAEHPTGRVGLPYEIVKALFDLHRETRRAFRTADYLSAVRDAIPGYAKWGRAWSSDDAYERDVFCAKAERYGTHRTPKLYNLIDPDAPDAVRVRWPVAPDRINALDIKLAAASALAQQAISSELPSVPKLGPDKLEFATTEPKLVTVHGFEVVAVNTHPGRTVLVTRWHDEEPTSYDCRRTNRVLKVDDNGNLIYENICKFGKFEDDQIAEVTFTDLPDALTLQKGDLVWYYADLQTSRSKTVNGSKAHTVIRHDYTLTGRHLERVERNKQAVFSY